MKNARKFKDYKSDSRTSKMWILPDGEVHSLGCLHREWIAGHLHMLKQRYGADFSHFSSDDDSVRLDALNHGFVRVNYQHQGGTLTVEANAAHFNDCIRAAVRRIVRLNAPQIDNIRVRLLDREGQIVKTGFARVFDSEDTEKAKRIPLVSERRA